MAPNRPLRILHVSNRNLGRNAATYNSSVDIKIANGFIRLGHMVWDFSFRDTARALSWFGSKKGGARRMNAVLLETATNLKPDYIYMGHSELVTSETMVALRERLPDARLSLTWQDSLYDNDYTHITERARLVHALFVSTGGPASRQFKSDGNRIAYFPNPVDPAIESLRQFEHTDLSADVLFCGRAKGRTLNARNAFMIWLIAPPPAPIRRCGSAGMVDSCRWCSAMTIVKRWPPLRWGLASTATTAGPPALRPGCGT